MYMRSALGCMSHRAAGSAVGLFLLAFGCKSPMTGIKVDARAADAETNVAPDAPSAPDLAGEDVRPPDLPGKDAVPDSAAADLPPTLVVPKWFRFDNRTDRAAFLPSAPPLQCVAHDVTGLARDCSFFLPDCSMTCAGIIPGTRCCETCGQGIPSLLTVPAGGSRSVAWNGSIFTKNSTICSDCTCEDELPAFAGTYGAVSQAYGAYRCEGGGCSLDADGVLSGAVPDGPPTALATPFAIPQSGDVVVLVISRLDLPDAGAASDSSRAFDSASPDRVATKDASSDGLPSAFAGVAGGTFQIAAANTAPDAGTAGNIQCVPSDSTAHYNLVFSADAASVQIIRTDPVQEQTMNGSLSSRSDTRLVYDLTNLFAGGELVVSSIDGNLVAELVIFGSGRPVIGCIQSPMTRL
jgi:hypothetical protein